MTTQVVTGKCRFVYCSVMSARKNEMNGKDEFSTQVLVPKTDTETVEALKAAAKEALKAKFGDKIPKSARNPMRDGDTETKSDGSPLGKEYAGHFFFNTKSTRKPGAVDANGQDLLGSNDIASGDYGRVSLNAYAYSQAGNNGVSFGLNNVMLLSKGESLGGIKSTAAVDFGIPGSVKYMGGGTVASGHSSADDNW